MINKILKKSERGQVIILIAFVFIGLIAIIGLVIDGGILLIEYARLKRGIDAASVAAASQFRKGFVADDLIMAGEELLRFNQSDATVEIFTCDYPNTPHDASLCSGVNEPKRKLVRVTATRHVNFGFMKIVGINGTDITATSVGEAASIDMVLAIDTSASMAYETTVGGDPNRSDPAVLGTHHGDDPNACNSDPNGRRCEPLGTVKDVAVDFVDELFYPYDRVALVTFTEQNPGGTRDSYLALPFSDNETNGVLNTEIQNAIQALRVFQPGLCPLPLAANPTNPGSCLFYGDPVDLDNYVGQPCLPYQYGNGDPTTCGASNIGGGLFMAGDQFAYARQDSFWVVIALIGGPANATTSGVTGNPPYGFCPSATWVLDGGGVGRHSGFCRDLDPQPYSLATATRHVRTAGGGYPADYDADDFARDGADYITSPVTGQGASLFTICMGAYCQEYPNVDDPASAEHLGQYMAEISGGPTANHGLYFYSNDAAGLDAIFAAIAANIFTRISQ